MKITTIPPKDLPVFKAASKIENAYLDLLYTMKICSNEGIEEFLAQYKTKAAKLDALMVRIGHTNKIIAAAIDRAEGRGQ